MNKVLKAIKLIGNPAKLVVYMNVYGFSRFLPDKLVIKCQYKYRMGKKLNLDNPKTFNEKLQWLKLYDRNPSYPRLVDKIEVKEYIKEVLGEEYIIPTLGVWDRFEDIDFDALPDRFVLKCTHDSGSYIICPNKKELDMEAARTKINKSLKRNYFWRGREWPYKSLKPRIIAEQFMEDETASGLKCYKFFCFDGEVKLILTGSANDDFIDFYDTDYNHLDIAVDGHAHSEPPYYVPINYKEMICIASKLSKGFPQVRVDLYSINGRIYFGELTFFHAGGMALFDPPEWDKKLGDWITLPK